MEITWLGYVLFPLGVLLLLFPQKWINYITIFSIPFTATSLLNTSSSVPLSPLQFFGSLFIVKQLIITSNISIQVKSNDKSIRIFFIFLAVVLLSLVMPLIIDGSLLIMPNASAADFDIIPLRLTTQNVKYPLPVIFGVFLSYCLIKYNNTFEKIEKSIKIYIFSALFACIWGFFQYLCDNGYIGIEYPYFLFNNALIDTMQGYSAIVEISGRSVTRISSTLHEASIFAKFVLTVIPLVLIHSLFKTKLFDRRFDLILLIILISILLLSASSTAYLGIFIVFLVTGIILFKLNILERRGAFFLLLLVFSIIIIYYQSTLFREYVISLVLEKDESGSALGRLFSITSSWEYFLQYPILGIGWSMVSSSDLIVFVLVSTGFVGFSIFASLIIYIIRRSSKLLITELIKESRRISEISVMGIGLLVSLLTIIIIGIFSGLEFYLGYFYFILSMIISYNMFLSSEYLNRNATKTIT